MQSLNQGSDRAFAIDILLLHHRPLPQIPGCVVNRSHGTIATGLQIAAIQTNTWRSDRTARRSDHRRKALQIRSPQHLRMNAPSCNWDGDMATKWARAGLVRTVWTQEDASGPAWSRRQREAVPECAHRPGHARHVRQGSRVGFFTVNRSLEWPNGPAASPLDGHAVQPRPTAHPWQAASRRP